MCKFCTYHFRHILKVVVAVFATTTINTQKLRVVQYTTFKFKVFEFPTPSVTTTFTLFVPLLIFSSNS